MGVNIDKAWSQYQPVGINRAFSRSRDLPDLDYLPIFYPDRSMDKWRAGAVADLGVFD
jgi:hypothetical protein